VTVGIGFDDRHEGPADQLAQQHDVVPDGVEVDDDLSPGHASSLSEPAARAQLTAAAA
jgi:hypothetical protein